MKKEKLVTITMSEKESPKFSICKGHVKAKDFDLAFKREGWAGATVKQAELKYEYWTCGPYRNQWTRANRKNPRAKPVTVLEW